MKQDNDGAFMAAYEKLNRKQKEAVDTIEGPVLVIAGPGTGKTQILTLRIANIIRLTDTAPESILALTFTKSGARAMRERLRSIVGSLAYRVPIYTFHGLCERLIHDYPEAYEKIIGGRAATDLEKVELLESVLTLPELVLLRPAGALDFYLRPLRDTISQMKQENILPNDLAQLVATEAAHWLDMPRFHEKGAHKGKERGEYTKKGGEIEKLQALVLAYRHYEVLLRDRKLYDFDDMIVETVRVLREREDIRLQLQELFQYILADEHQDVNGAQNEILDQLSSFHSSPNLFVVGDEKQAIYRFQGASLENFLYFEEKYPDTKVITLIDNYRSTQTILDAGHELIKVESGPLLDYRVPLVSAKNDLTTLTLTAYPHQALEDTAVIKAVKEALASGVTPSEIAVIVRGNRDVEALASTLRKAGVLVDASAQGDILNHPLVIIISELLRAVSPKVDEPTLARVFQGSYWGISVADTLRVMSACSYARPLSAVLADRAYLETLGLDAVDRVEQVMTVLAEVRIAASLTAPHRLLQTLITKSGLLDQALSVDTFESTRIIRRLYDEVETLVHSGEARDIYEVTKNLERRLAHGLPLTAPFINTGSSGVQVMTAHKSKGLEFKVVIVPRLTEQAWGGGKRPQYFKVPLLRTAALALEGNEDERRLLYVAMTRAKSTLLLSYADTTSEGKELSPSPFLAEVPVSLPVIPFVSDELFAPLSVLRDFSTVSSAVRQILHQVVTTRGFSATSLNNVIKNPWHYFYRNVVRLPDIQTLPLQFGSAMHGVLEYATKAHTKTGSLPSFSELRLMLERELQKLPLGTVEFTDLFAKGQTVLATYRPHLAATLPLVTKEEFSVSVILPTRVSDLPALPLTGKLDRLDLDAQGLVTRVVDYKTGKAKTRNDIEGKTAQADKSYRRQLEFYSLLLHLHGNERYLCDRGVLSFIEADSKGRIHEEEFDSGDSERKAVTAEIETAAALVLSGEFLLDESLLGASDYVTLGESLLRRLREVN